MDNIIRKITVSNAITGKNEDGTDYSKNMIYTVNTVVTVVVDGKSEKHTISSIEESEDKRVLIYLSKDEETQLWRNLPLNSETTIEYVIN